MTTQITLPTRLTSEPIVDVTCEVRFEASKAGVANLLPGLLVGKLGDFEDVEKLVVSDFPEALLVHEAFKYQPHLRLKNGNLFVAVSNNSLAISSKPPYSGWGEFKAYVLKVFEVLRESKLAQKVTRLSLRYADVIPTESSSGLDLLDVDLRLAHVRDYESVQINLSRRIDDIFIITQVGTPAQAGDGRQGLVVDVDTTCDAEDDFWGTLDHALNRLHSANKEVFFGLLKHETLEALGPEY